MKKLLILLFSLLLLGCEKEQKVTEPENGWCQHPLLRATGEITEQGFNGAMYYIIVKNYCTGNDLEYRTITSIYQPPIWKIGDGWIHPEDKSW